MAVKVKDAASSAAKFVARAQAAGADYAKGVAGAGDTWQSQATAAKQAFADGVTAAIGRDAFSKGIARAGAAKYVANASGKGAQRYPTGVAGAQTAWQQATQPFLDTIAALQLPPKSSKGSPNNLQRVATVANALRAKKLAM